jgi:hypothetical protein
VLAADSGAGFPLQDIFWTLLLVFGLVLFVWLLMTVLVDVFDRDDLTNAVRVGWTVLVFVVPLLGSLAYLVTRSRDVGELKLLGPRRTKLTRPPTDPHSRSVTGDAVTGRPVWPM